MPCPFCEAKISRTAKKCQFCGEWVNAATAEQKAVVKGDPQPPQRKSSEKKEPIREIIIESKPWHSKPLVFFGYVFLAIVLLGGGWVILKSVIPPEQYSSITSAISATINKIQDNLSR